MIRYKITETARRKKRQEMQENDRNHFGTGIKGSVASAGQSQPNDSGNIFKKGLSSLTGLFQTREEKMQLELKANANLIYSELTRFSRFFINLQLPYEEAYNLLSTSGDNFLIDKAKM